MLVGQADGNVQHAVGYFVLQRENLELLALRWHLKTWMQTQLFRKLVLSEKRSNH